MTHIERVLVLGAGFACGVAFSRAHVEAAAIPVYSLAIVVVFGGRWLLDRRRTRKTPI